MRMLVLLYPLRVVGAILAWMMAHVSSSRRSSPNSPGGAAFGWGGPSSALPTSIPKPNELLSVVGCCISPPPSFCPCPRTLACASVIATVARVCGLWRRLVCHDTGVMTASVTAAVTVEVEGVSALAVPPKIPSRIRVLVVWRIRSGVELQLQPGVHTPLPFFQGQIA